MTPLEAAAQAITEAAEEKIKVSRQMAHEGRYAEAAQAQAEYSALVRARWLMREAFRKAS